MKTIHLQNNSQQIDNKNDNPHKNKIYIYIFIYLFIYIINKEQICFSFWKGRWKERERDILVLAISCVTKI